MSGRADIRSGLVAAVLALGSNLGRLLEHKETAWASATFSGARHTIVLEFKGDAQVDAGERFIARLPEHEFILSGYLVADATITRAGFGLLPVRRLEVHAELLLLKED